MRRLVVTTDERGEKIDATDVEEHAVVAHVLGFHCRLPTALFYIDGQLVSDEELAAVKAAAVRAASSSSETPPPSPEQVKDYNETLQQGFDDVRRAQVQTMRDMTECTKMFGQMLIEHQRQFADEAARQREITRKSLDDVDLLGRSVKATQFHNVLAVAGRSDPHRSSGGITLRDIWVGFQRTFFGEQ